MDNILVSVVIPTYSRNDTLQRAIASVMKQTHQNFEIIVVDDNKPESEWRASTAAMMAEYTDPRIRYLQNEHNMGGGLTRNEGIKAANGEYIAFLDDDDEYTPERIEKQLGVFLKADNDKLALVYCYAKFINADGSSTYSDRRDFHGNCLYEAMEQNCIAATSQWMARKSALMAVGCFPDVPCKQDSQTILRLLKAGYELEVIPEELSYYYDVSHVISGAGKKNILGEELYRAECRKLYYRLEDWQILNIEYRFATYFYRYYQANNLTELVEKEWKLMKKLNPKAAYIFRMKEIWHKIKK